MDINCFKCGGSGYIEAYSWNQGGVCFTCNGTGTVKTFKASSINKLTYLTPIIDYVAHSSNRDLAHVITSGEFNSLDPKPKSEVNRELRKRAKEYFQVADTSTKSLDAIAKEIVKELDKREKVMPKPYEKNPRYTSEVVSLVPTHWIKKFQGNSLRRDKEEMTEFTKQLLAEGLKEPISIVIGQNDRKVILGEGNHRTFAFIEAGLDFIPARIVRQSNIPESRGEVYDRMSAVPVGDYFKGEARPDEVFDTYYDKGYITKITEDFMIKTEHSKLELEGLKGFEYDSKENVSLFSKQFEKPSKALVKQLDSMIQFMVENGASKEDIEDELRNSLSWKSKEVKFAILDVNRAIKELSSSIDAYGDFTDEAKAERKNPKPVKENDAVGDDIDYNLVSDMNSEEFMDYLMKL